MERHKLTGTLSGANRAEILTQIKASAATYFGTPCIVVKLTGDRIDGDQFTTEYEAAVWHDIERRTYGPGVCRGCSGEDWPHRRLNTTAVWE